LPRLFAAFLALCRDGFAGLQTRGVKVCLTRLQDKCDADVAHWYAQKGPNYKALMNDVIRAHMEAEIADKKAV